MSGMDEEVLVQRAKGGDRQAFRELMERHQRSVFQQCLSILRNSSDAQDLVQETFIRVHRNLDKFEGNAKFSTWLYRIARNACIDHLRKTKRRDASNFDEYVDMNNEAAFDDNFMPTPLGFSPSRVAGRRELREQIERAFDTLTPAHREIINLREIEGLSYEEIAERLDIAKGTVMSRLHHARQNAQRALADYVNGDLKASD